MFYDAEILTSREHGIATVWLFATLGSRSTTKKIGKKDIQHVDVSKACNTIINGRTPMALRLQSNLLFGVSKVFSSQCQYVLMDVKEMESKIRMTYLNRRERSNIDLAQKKPANLQVPLDPFFNLEEAFADLGVDLEGIETTTAASSSGVESVGASPRSRRSSFSSHGELPDIEIPSSLSKTGESPSFVRRQSIQFHVPGANDHVPGNRNQPSISGIDHSILPEADFAFDVGGNIFDLEPAVDRHTTLLDLPDLKDMSSQGEHPHDGDIQMGGEDDDDRHDVLGQAPDDNRPIFSVQGGQSSSSALSSPLSSPLTSLASNTPSFAHISSPRSSSESLAANISAPQRRRREILPDFITTLRSSEIRALDADYEQNMTDAIAATLAKRITAQSRRNAECSIWTTGIANIGYATAIAPQLERFYGERLRQTVLTARMASEAQDASMSRKRASEEEDATLSAKRRRSDQHDAPDSDEGIGLTLEDTPSHSQAQHGPDSIELARRAPTPLSRDRESDISNTMPWNLASTRNRSRSRSTLRSWEFGRNVAGLGRGLFSAGASVSSFGRASARGRLADASPLLTYGLNRMKKGIDGLASTRSWSSDIGGEAAGLGDFGSDNFEGMGGMADDASQDDAELGVGDRHDRSMEHADDPHHFPTRARVHGDASQTQLSTKSTDGEALNFLDFVVDKIRKRNEAVAAPQAAAESHPDDANNAAMDSGEDRTSNNSIAFHEVLPEAENSHVVAAQGFLHALSLGSAGLMSVEQKEMPFGTIRLTPEVVAD